MLTKKTAGGLIAGGGDEPNKMTVKITRGVVAGGEKRKPGDIYTGPDARILVNMGKAVYVDAPAKEKESEPEPAELETSSGATVKSSKKKVSVKRGSRK